jgi:drug/metabolite transporter (DMT)-like permease
MERLIMKKKDAVSVLYIPMVLATFFWALGHPLGRLVLRSVHPFHLAAVTQAAGLLSVLIYLAVRGRLGLLFRLSLGDTLAALGLGALGFGLYNILTFSALSRIPASMNAILVATNVILVALLSAIFLRERITWPRAAGILVAFIGAGLVTLNQGFALGGKVDLLGCAFSLLAALSFALYTVLGKRLVERNDPLIVTTLALFSGSVLLVILAASAVGLQGLASAPAVPWLLMALLGVTMIGFAYPAWFECLRRLPASRASVFIYMTPVFAVILSLIILGERFGWPFYAGGALVLGGIALSSRG